MASPCAKGKTLRKIIAEVLSADDFEWANIQYCNKQVSKKICFVDKVDSPIACIQLRKCPEPLTIITTGMGNAPSWPKEWEIETNVLQKRVVSSPTPMGKASWNASHPAGFRQRSLWHKNIMPGGTLCIVNSSMEGHCIKFKDRFSKDEKRWLEANPKGEKVINLLVDLAESICEISLTKQVKQLWKKRM